jgi:hypothetical protein
MARGWYQDTDPKALEVFFRLQREMTPSQKINLVFELNETLMGSQMAEIRARHPEASGREVFLRMAARRLDRETMIRVYGWDPETV